MEHSHAVVRLLPKTFAHVSIVNLYACLQMPVWVYVVKKEVQKLVVFYFDLIEKRDKQW